MNRSKWILTVIAVVTAHPAGAATFTILNMDGPGEGLNDTTAFTPVGGNTATTLGAARLAVLQEAGRIWGAQLTSAVPIVVEAKFDPLTCESNTGTLGSAGPLTFFSQNAAPTIVYPAALADSLAGVNLPVGTGANDIHATFNSNLNGSPGCLFGAEFYLGFDHNSPFGDSDLLSVVLHEFGHGLGVTALMNQDGTSVFDTAMSIFAQSVYSESLGLHLPAMTPAQRQTAFISGTDLVWNGTHVNGQIGLLTNGLSTGGHLKLYAPGTYSSGSSVSHWDVSAEWNPDGSAARSLLMEPFITPNPLGLTDFTGCMLRDMGWQGTRCPDQTGVATIPTAMPQTVNATEDTAIQITLIGTDLDTPSLTYAIVTPPSRGALTPPASLVSSNGVIYTYTPAANLHGTDTFIFSVNDGTNAPGTATVTIQVAPVNDVPVANAQTVNATAGKSRAIALTGSDVETTVLAYYVMTSPAKGTLTGSSPNMTYRANADASGVDTFVFRVHDGFLFSEATVTINISAAEKKKSGGGSLDWLALLALLLLIAARVRARDRLQPPPAS